VNKSGVYGRMRIGTWNLAGRWDHRHRRLMDDASCDVWLLTEVRADVGLPAHHRQVTRTQMLSGKYWAAIVSRGPIGPKSEPHFASVVAEVDGFVFCASVFPWRSAIDPPWAGKSHGERTERALGLVVPALSSSPLVWGGDWNHALTGAESAGSARGQRAIVAAVSSLGLEVPTIGVPHWNHGSTIDHIAVSSLVDVLSIEQMPASVAGVRISDHDAYVVEVRT
jgi:hypothetical protein